MGSGSKSRKLPRVLTQEDAAALLAVPSLKRPTGLRNRCLLELMYRCGLRVSEVCGLHVRDVRRREKQIHLRPEVAKGGQEGWAYLDPRTLELLELWKDVRRNYAAKKPHLFTTLEGGPVDRRYVWAMMRRYSRRAGLEHPANPHALRHTYATELLREGFDLRQVQELLRHSNIQTTSVYLHVFDHELQRKIWERS